MSAWLDAVTFSFAVSPRPNKCKGSQANEYKHLESIFLAEFFKVLNGKEASIAKKVQMNRRLTFRPAETLLHNRQNTSI
jgi:hypothetical protein